MHISKASVEAIIRDDERKERRRQRKDAVPDLVLACSAALILLLDRAGSGDSAQRAELVDVREGLRRAIENAKGGA